MGMTEGYLGEPGFAAGSVVGTERREGEVLVRQMGEWDLDRIMGLRTVVRWSADPDAFGLLRGMRDARWAVADAGGCEGDIVGMVGAVPLGEVGVLCHLAVHDSYRRAGIGGGLARWAVSYLRSRGAGVVRLDSTEAAERLYLSMGFEPVLRRTVYRIEDVTTAREPREDGAYRVSTLTIGDLPEVYGVDRWSFGGDRSALIFAAIRLHPGRGLVARDVSGRIKGYLVRSVSGGLNRIGPLLAEGEPAARALLGAALRSVRDSGGRPVEITCASPNEEDHRLLRDCGFEGAPDRLRMELGAAPESRGIPQYGTTPYLAT